MKKYPNYRKGLRAAIPVMSVSFVILVLLFYWVSLQPAFSEISLSLAFRPISKTILPALFPSMILGCMAGFIAAYRP